MSLKESIDKKIYLRSKKDKTEDSVCTACVCNECSMNYVIDGTSAEGLCVGCETCLGSESIKIEPRKKCPIGKINNNKAS